MRIFFFFLFLSTFTAIANDGPTKNSKLVDCADAVTDHAVGVGSLPPLDKLLTLEPIPDMVQDAAILQSIRAIKDASERERARVEYQKLEDKRIRKWIAAAGLGASGILWALLGRELASDPSLWKILATIPAAALGILAGDWLNSEIHYKIDNVWYNSDNKTLREFANDGRRHHEDQKACLKNTYLGRLAEAEPYTTLGFLAVIASFQTQVPAYLIDTALASIGVVASGIGSFVNYSLTTMLGFFALSSSHSTWTHQMAHTPNPPWFWRQLQKLGISLPPERHAAHHKPPYDDNYSTQTGWWDRIRPKSYWQRRMRRYYEKHGVMPGTWIQDPRAIPADIVEKLVKEYKENASIIPPELWGYAPIAYPNRVPEALKEPLAFVQQKWRADFIKRRQMEFARLAKLDLEGAKKLWEFDQKNYPWIYGPNPQPLNLEAGS